MLDLSTIYEKVSHQNVTCNETPKCLAMVEGKCVWFSKKKDKKQKKNETTKSKTEN